MEVSEELYLIRKGGYYYRPNSQGYTISTAEAGRYTLEEAIRITHPNGPDGPRDGMDYMPAPAQALSTQAAERGEPVTEKRIVALGNIALAYENDQRENAFDIALDAAYSAGRKSAPPTEAQIRADERERCAKVAEGQAPVASNHAAYTIAAAIRSLKESDNGAG